MNQNFSHIRFAKIICTCKVTCKSRLGNSSSKWNLHTLIFSCALQNEICTLLYFLALKPFLPLIFVSMQFLLFIQLLQVLQMITSTTNNSTYSHSYNSRSSRQEVFCKKGFLRNFAKFTGKHLCQSLFLIKKRVWHRCFPVDFAKFLSTPFYIKYLPWLLLPQEVYRTP